MIDQQAIDRLEIYHQQGRLIRHAWTGTDAQGRETACLLAALVPECGVMESADSCPASVLPPWLANLTPWLDDAGTAAAWPGFVARYVAVLRSWNLDAAQSQRCDYLCRALIVREARSHTLDPQCTTACDTVIALCDRAAAGSSHTAEEWAAARDAATTTILSARWSGAAAAAIAAGASAAREAAAMAAGAAATAAEATADHAPAACDRMIDGILTVLETEIGPRGSK